MEAKKIVIIMRNDLIGYPPTISLINALLAIGKEVVYVGEYSDKKSKAKFESRGVNFVPIIYPNSGYSKNKIINFVKILKWRIKYTIEMNKYLSSIEKRDDVLFWFIFSDAAALIGKALMRHRYLIHFYEFENPHLTWKKLLISSPLYDANKFIQGAESIVHCEYNRAMIMHGLNGIVKPTFILPNKPYSINIMETPDDEINNLLQKIRNKIEGKKVILYQGIFNTKERRLDEFCQAMKLLSDDYVFIIMGKISESLDYIKEKYSFENIIFMPFIRPPYHLLITKLAYIGILSYRPQSTSLYNVVNTYYCAPNKIFEYSKFGVPMISNELPGLKQIFDKYGCGKIIEGDITPSKIVDVVLSVENNYMEMQKGSFAYYSSVDFENIVHSIVS